MPHRVANFLRTSSSGLVHTKKKARTNTTNAAAHRSPANSSSSSPYASDHEDGHHPVLDLTEAFKNSRRLSLPFRRSHKDVAASPAGPLVIDWLVESPPIVFHGTASESTGALVSGQMMLNVRDEAGLDVDAFTAELHIHVTHKRPVQHGCPDCVGQKTLLKSWTLIGQPVHLAPGRHQYPFSVLLDGHLPASVDSNIHAISYDFRAEAKPSRSTTAAVGSTALPPVVFTRALNVSRALAEPEQPHHSIRIFPPTNIKAGAYYSTVIRPTGCNSVSLRLDGLASLNEKTGMTDLWKLKKISWKLEQTIKTVAPACDRHTHIAASNDSSGEDALGRPGIERHETRLLGEGMLHSGWTSDFAPGKDGSVDMDFKYTMNNVRQKNWHTRAACDARSRDGTSVTHALLIELVVSKEYAPVGKPHLSAPTGTGRILRMHYNVAVTDHPGLGVSWDEEQPPIYEDVPPSPPEYPSAELPIDYEDVLPLDYHDLETLDAQRRSGDASRRGSSS